MAIQRNSGTTDEVLKLDVNNGDLAALKKAVEKLGFKDEESLLRYALAVFTKAAVSSVTITEPSGQQATLGPAEALLKAKEEHQPTL